MRCRHGCGQTSCGVVCRARVRASTKGYRARRLWAAENRLVLGDVVEGHLAQAVVGFPDGDLELPLLPTPARPPGKRKAAPVRLGQLGSGRASKHAAPQMPQPQPLPKRDSCTRASFPGFMCMDVNRLDREGQARRQSPRSRRISSALLRSQTTSNSFSSSSWSSMSAAR
jgi:hypothetical protein